MLNYVKVNDKTFIVLIADSEFNSGMAHALGVVPVDVKRDGYSAQPIIPVEDARNIEQLVRNPDFQSALAHVYRQSVNSEVKRPFDISYTITHHVQSYPEGYNPHDSTEE